MHEIAFHIVNIRENILRNADRLQCESWDAPCNALGDVLAGTEAATRELDPDRALAEVPFAALVVGGGGGGGNVGAKFWIFVVDK